MPAVTLRVIGVDDKEELLIEYFCDWPDCPNVAEHVVGVLPGLRMISVVCKEHAALMASRRRH
jgi:hypothetical protein